ncbi:hypothetical protein I215_06607 [Galbibacter marinus]|uniref:Uncharacterized protein n=1 Tax=Galbibacter marinus TaxID=555500 RepID=K2P3H6_9FLAO|nr:hypothetical protein I215_06607 [Galbibacter marinus]
MIITFRFNIIFSSDQTEAKILTRQGNGINWPADGQVVGGEWLYAVPCPGNIFRVYLVEIMLGYLLITMDSLELRQSGLNPFLFVARC